MCRWLCFCAVLIASAAAAQNNWVDQLRAESGYVCCTNNDGQRLGEPDWDTQGKVTETTSGYRVFHGQTKQWYDVPPQAVVMMRNQDGIVRVWWGGETDDLGNVVTPTVRCFLPGALT